MIKKITYSIVATALLICGCTSYITDDSDDDFVGQCWVADTGGKQVMRIALANDEIAAVNNTDVGTPISIIYDPYRGFTWVGDADGRLLLLTERAQMNRCVYGFDEPSKLALSPKEGAVWVLDTGLNRVIKTESRGSIGFQLNGYVDGRDIVCDPVTAEVFVARGDRITRLDYKGNNLGEFTGFTDITDLEYDGSINRLWVVDAGAGAFIRMSNDGEIEEYIDNQFDEPRDLAVNSLSHYVYVAGILDGEWELSKFKYASDGNGNLSTNLGWHYKGTGLMKEDVGDDEVETDFFGPMTITASSNDTALWINDYEHRRLIKAHEGGDKATVINIMGGFFDVSGIEIINKPNQ